MEPQWSSLQIVLTALGIIFAGLLFGRKKFRIRIPPGPTPWPVVGNLLQLGSLPHQDLAKLAKKYGPLMSLRLGSVYTLVASSPKIAEEFLKTQDSVWASRPRSTAGKLMTFDHSDIAFAPYGPHWRYARKIFIMELFTAKRLADFQKSRKEELMAAVMSIIDGCSGGSKSVPITECIGKMSLNNMTRMLMNEGVLSDEAKAVKDKADFQQTIKDFFALSGAFYLGDYIPWLDPFDPEGTKKKMRANAKKYNEFLESILDDHRQKHKMQLESAEDDPQGADKVQDLVDVLLTRPTNVDGQRLSESQIKAIMEDVILAGTETSSGSIEWGLSEMLKNPHTLKKAQAEMDSVVGRDRLVEESDLPNLPYLNAVLKETFRLHPVGPLMVPHESMQDCEILGYKIPAKTRLIVNVYAIQRDQEVWNRPEEFDPDRFLGSEKEMHGLDFDLIPFGSGRRMCPGKGLGILLVQYALAVFIQTCDLSLPANLKPEDLDMDEKFGLSLPRLNPLPIIAVPRLTKHVFRDFQT